MKTKRKRPSDRRTAPSKRRATRKPKRDRGRTGPAETPFSLRARKVRVTPALRAYVRKRVGFKLGRYALSLQRIVVRFERPSGPTGAPSFSSRFSLLVAGAGRVVVEATRSDPREAFDASIDAAERTVRRLLARRRGRRVRRKRPS
jgi:ribosome-associated translation inhibitor RaiA